VPPAAWYNSTPRDCLLRHLQLQVLEAVNLVLADSGITVVIGMVRSNLPVAGGLVTCVKPLVTSVN
jgi:hypothetical protein